MRRLRPAAVPRRLRPRSVRGLARAWPALAVFLAMAGAAGGSASYVREVTRDDAARLLRARTTEFASMVETDARVMQAAVTIARTASAGHGTDWLARDVGPVLGSAPGMGMWIAAPDGRGGRVLGAIGDRSVLRGTMTPKDWHAVFAVRGRTVRPTLVDRRADGSLVLGIVTDLAGGRAAVFELDVRRLIAGAIGRRAGVEGALYFGATPIPGLLVAATRSDGDVPPPRVSHALTLGGVPSLLVVGDPTAVGPAWLPPAIFLGGLLIALAAAALVEALRRRAAELAHRADHDELTGLANRALLHRRVEEAASQGAAGVLLFDLDDFKAINDTLGHDAGDAALRVIAERLHRVVGERAVAVRLGGDEFALCTTSADPAELHALAARVLDEVGGAAAIAGRALHLELSLGIAAWPGTTSAPGDLLRDADIAMYTAKLGRRAHAAAAIVHYEPALRVAAEGRTAALAELRSAVAEEQLVLHYQPLVDLVSGRTTALAALVRWQHPTRGLLAPEVFMPFAEEGGMVAAIGRLVVEIACRDLVALRGIDPALTMSVGVSALELAEPSFPEEILAVTAAHGLEPAALELEVGERVLADAPGALRALELLRARGVRVAIGDFGGGYASPRSLRRLPTTALKIDRAFVADGAGDAGRGILAALVGLAHGADLDVVAAGVETPAQLERVRELGCVRAQGAVFSRPLPLTELGDWLGGALAA